MLQSNLDSSLRVIWYEPDLLSSCLKMSSSLRTLSARSVSISSWMSLSLAIFLFLIDLSLRCRVRSKSTYRKLGNMVTEFPSSFYELRHLYNSSPSSVTFLIEEFHSSKSSHAFYKTYIFLILNECFKKTILSKSKGIWRICDHLWSVWVQHGNVNWTKRAKYFKKCSEHWFTWLQFCTVYLNSKCNKFNTSELWPSCTVPNS